MVSEITLSIEVCPRCAGPIEAPHVEPVTTQGMTFVHNPPEDPEELESWRMASALPIEDQIGWQITPTGNGTWGVLPPQIEHDLNLDQLETYAAELAVVTSACCDLNAYGQIIVRTPEPAVVESEHDPEIDATTNLLHLHHGIFRVTLAHTFIRARDYGRDVTVEWASRDVDGRTDQEHFSVTERDLDGLIRALTDARARLTEVDA